LLECFLEAFMALRAKLALFFWRGVALGSERTARAWAAVERPARRADLLNEPFVPLAFIRFVAFLIQFFFLLFMEYALLDCVRDEGTGATGLLLLREKL